MNFIIENWAIIFALVCVPIVVAVWAIKFSDKPTDKQIELVKNWLLYAVLEAERIYQSGTGKLKLHYVYDQFVQKFPKLTSVITFDMFSFLVDEVLVEMREILETNKDIEAYVSEYDERLDFFDGG